MINLSLKNLKNFHPCRSICLGSVFYAVKGELPSFLQVEMGLGGLGGEFPALGGDVNMSKMPCFYVRKKYD